MPLQAMLMEIAPPLLLASQRSSLRGLRMARTVFVVQHEHELPSGCDDVKLVGIYSTRARAESAVEHAKTLQGFAAVPEGFHIDEYTIDANHWMEGFVTLEGDQERNG